MRRSGNTPIILLRRLSSSVTRFKRLVARIFFQNTRGLERQSINPLWNRRIVSAALENPLSSSWVANSSNLSELVRHSMRTSAISLWYFRGTFLSTVQMKWTWHICQEVPGEHYPGSWLDASITIRYDQINPGETLLFQVREHPIPGKFVLNIIYPGSHDLQVAIDSDTDTH